MSQKPVIICGAGIASLLLAQSLQRSRIPFEIFERDASLTFRGQGYRLRLSDAGLEAIESALGPEAYESFYDQCSKTGGSGFIGLNAVTGERDDTSLGGETLDSKGGKIVGCARGEMRRIFMKGVEDHVHFNRYVKGYELVEDGVRAVFADGSKSDVGCLLVGGGKYTSCDIKSTVSLTDCDIQKGSNLTLPSKYLVDDSKSTILAPEVFMDRLQQQRSKN